MKYITLSGFGRASVATLMWETWFVENGPQEIKNKLKPLETEVHKEEKELRHDIGEQASEIIALSERLDSLNMLAEQQCAHLERICGNALINEPNALNVNVLCQKDDDLALKRRNDFKLGSWLAFHADRHISKVKYAAASQALFLAQELNIESPQLTAQRLRLKHKLEQWLESGTLISQSTYTALLIFLRCTPSELGSIFLQKRLQYIKTLLSTPKGSSKLFKLVDSTAFIHTQIVNDFSQSRLISRKLIDMPTFSSSVGFSALISPRFDEANAIRCFPEECYSHTPPEDDGMGRLDLEKFTKFVALEVESRASELLGTVKTIEELTSVLNTTVQQSQDVLNAEKSVVAAILNSFEPAYEQSYLNLIEANSRSCGLNDWDTVFAALESNSANLSRIARLTKQSVPEFSTNLEQLEQECKSRISGHINECYSRLHQELLSKDSSGDLKLAADKIVQLQYLDKKMLSLKGSLKDTPEQCYLEFAELLKKHLDSQQDSKRVYFGDKNAAHAFEVQCVIDEYLEDFEWSASALETVRKVVLGEDGVPSEIENDALLLKPIVM